MNKIEIPDKKCTLINGDCISIMKDIPDESIDMILCDLPYGTTSCSWDTIIPFEPLWEQYNRIIKDDGVIALFCSGLFTIDLIVSNRSNFRYKLIWSKNVPTGMSSCKYRPMKYYEEICIFYKKIGTYNPQLKERVGKNKSCYKYNHYCGKSNHVNYKKINKKYDENFVQPSDILEFKVVPNRARKVHPTQKPVELLEYLIKTYTNSSDIVLDNCMGSGSTGVACCNLNREFIGIELNEEYYKIACKRILDAKKEEKNE